VPTSFPAVLMTGPRPVTRVGAVPVPARGRTQVLPLVGRLARLGCTRMGSPGIFG
jgi:hypothetical protein